MQYPNIHVRVKLGDRTVTIRPISPADKELEAEFVRGLSDRSRYYRFHTLVKELTPRQLEYFTTVDFPNNMALIAVIGSGDEEKQIAVARYVRLPDQDSAEVAVAVADDWQGKGLGTHILTELRNVARRAGIRRLHMNVLSENRRMLRLAHELGFATDLSSDDYVSKRLDKPLSGPDSEATDAVPEKVFRDPASEYATPQALLDDTGLTQAQKKDLLRRWRYDAEELSVAEDEGMISGEPGLLHQVLTALHSLESRPPQAGPAT
jgi:RimJ/RimL family protein N-acetyltransferase